MKILSGTIARSWMRILLAIVALVVVLASIWIWGGESDVHKKIDLTLKTCGGLLAMGAVYIAFRRTRSAEKGQYSDRFAKAVAQIASNQLAIRLGGLASIEALSKETEDEFIRVWTYLGEFLRYPPELAPWRNEPKAGETKEEQKEPLGQRPDIAAVATMLRSFTKTHLRWLEGNQLPLRDAKLQGANLHRTNLQGADLCYANLQYANLHDAKLQDTTLVGTNLQGTNLITADMQDAVLFDANLQDTSLFRVNLQGANLSRANLQGADLLHANLQGANLFHANLRSANLCSANLQDAKLQSADLHSTNLQGTNLSGTNIRDTSLQERELQQLFSKDDDILLKGALFSLDALKEALHIEDLMPEKISAVYYLASDGPLPDDWPADYKPHPITYEEWQKKRKQHNPSN